MRLIGAILMIAASASFGLIRASELKKRPGFLRALADSLILLKNEIVSRRISIPDSTAHVSGLCAESMRPFYRSITEELKDSVSTLSDIWNREIHSLSFLKPQEQERLRELGAHLGKYDADAQEKALEACIAAIEQFAVSAQNESRQFGRLYTGLGLTVGTMLAVALY